MKESTSGPTFLRRTALVALIVGVFLGMVVAWRWGWRSGAGFTGALLWSLANFAILAAILREATNPEGARKTRVAALAAVKIVGLYGLGFAVLLQGWFPLPAVMAGFSWPLVVVLLRSLAGGLRFGAGPARGDDLERGSTR